MATTDSTIPATQPISRDIHAEYARGVRYLLGDGVTQDLTASIECFHYAAQHGQQDAAHILSLLPIKGPQSRPDWLQRYRRTLMAVAILPAIGAMLGLAALCPVFSRSPQKVTQTTIALPQAHAVTARKASPGGSRGHRR